MAGGFLVKFFEFIILGAVGVVALLGFCLNLGLAYAQPQINNPFVGFWASFIAILLVLLVMASIPRYTARRYLIRTVFAVISLVMMVIIVVSFIVGGNALVLWALLWTIPCIIYAISGLGRRDMLRPRNLRTDPSLSEIEDLRLERKYRLGLCGTIIGHIARALILFMMIMFAIQGITYAALDVFPVPNSEFMTIPVGWGEYRSIHIVCNGPPDPTIPTVWLLHGTTSAGISLMALQRELEIQAGRRSCYYDRAGYGYSDRFVRTEIPVLEYYDEFELRDVLTMHYDGIEGGFRQVELWGHASGGDLAMRYAARFPMDVAAVILVDSVPGDYYFEVERYEDTWWHFNYMHRWLDALRAFWPLGVGAIVGTQYYDEGFRPHEFQDEFTATYVDSKMWETQWITFWARNRTNDWMAFPPHIPLFSIRAITGCQMRGLDLDWHCEFSEERAAMERVNAENVILVSEFGQVDLRPTWYHDCVYVNADEIVRSALFYLVEVATYANGWPLIP